MKFRITAVAALAALALNASDAGAEGYYIAVGGGGNKPLDQEFELGAAGLPIAAVLDQEYEWGWLAGAMLGYDLGNGLRVELEGTYRSNDVDEISLGNAISVNGTGDLSVASGMLNVLYDIDLGGPVVPYIGAGAGIAYLNYDQIGIQGVPTAFVAYDDTAWSAAVQGILGVSYKVSDQLDLFADYRFFSTIGLDTEDNPTFFLPILVDNDEEYQTHSIMVGLRYSFGGY